MNPLVSKRPLPGSALGIHEFNYRYTTAPPVDNACHVAEAGLGHEANRTEWERVPCWRGTRCGTASAAQGSPAALHGVSQAEALVAVPRNVTGEGKTQRCRQLSTHINSSQVGAAACGAVRTEGEAALLAQQGGKRNQHPSACQSLLVAGI